MFFLAANLDLFVFSGTSIQAARFKLALALQGLSRTLKNTENFATTSSPVMINLADNIGSAVTKLKTSVNPFYSPRTNRALPLSLVNGKTVKKVSSPRCPKPLKKMSDKNGVVPERELNISVHSNLDLSEKNKIWLVPKIQLTDIIKSKVIKSESF